MVRFKYRYIAVCIEPAATSSLSLNYETLVTAVRDKVQELHGDYGVGAIDPGFKVKYMEKQTRIFIVRVQHGPHRFVASIIPLVHRLGDTSVSCSIIYTGATLRQCFKQILKFHKQELMKLWGSVTSIKGKNKVTRAFAELDAQKFMEKRASFYRK